MNSLGIRNDHSPFIDHSLNDLSGVYHVVRILMGENDSFHHAETLYLAVDRAADDELHFDDVFHELLRRILLKELLPMRLIRSPAD